MTFDEQGRIYGVRVGAKTWANDRQSGGGVELRFFGEVDLSTADAAAAEQSAREFVTTTEGAPPSEGPDDPPVVVAVTKTLLGDALFQVASDLLSGTAGSSLPDFSSLAGPVGEALNERLGSLGMRAVVKSLSVVPSPDQEEIFAQARANAAAMPAPRTGSDPGMPSH